MKLEVKKANANIETQQYATIVFFNEPSHSVSFSLNRGVTLGKNNTNLTLYKLRRYM